MVGRPVIYCLHQKWRVREKSLAYLIWIRQCIVSAEGRVRAHPGHYVCHTGHHLNHTTDADYGDLCVRFILLFFF